MVIYESSKRNVAVTVIRLIRICGSCLWRPILFFLAASTLAAQDPPRTGLRLESSTPPARAVVDSFLAAIDAERFGDAARWLDMASFKVFFAQTVASVRGSLPQAKMTVDELMAQDSTMPRAVAEWQLSRMRQYSDSEPFGYLAHQFARVRTQRELFALTPEEAAARWLEAQDPRAQIRESWRQSGCKQPIPAELLRSGRATLRGVVVADSFAYAVLERGFAREVGPIIEPANVITVRRTQQGWRVAPQYGLLTGSNVAFVSQVGPGGC